MMVWGVCMTTMGLTHDFSGLMAARFFLGLAEAGLFPGVNYYLSCWYTRKEFGIRAVGAHTCSCPRFGPEFPISDCE